MPEPFSARCPLPRARRLLKTREFDSARKQGQRAAKGCLIVNWLPLPSSPVSKVGVITSRKIGKAVVRSRARRLLREVFRLHQRDLAEPMALVLVARDSIVGKRFADVERDFLSLMRQSRLLKTPP